jgi:acetyltransferase
MRNDAVQRMLAPESIAIIGASEVAGKVGYTVLSNLIAGGFQGPLLPVNARRDEVQGLPAVRRVADLPLTPDLAIVCTPAATVPGLVRECGEKGIQGLLILTAGFREVGQAGQRLQEEVCEAQRAFPGMRIVGPNCLGLICPRSQLNASFALGMPQPGSVAFLSQSGALCTAVLDWALLRGIGFSHFISLGNQLDVGFADLLETLAEDPHTSAAILYIESIENARHFLAAAAEFACRKPLVAYKAGRFAESAKAASSHTGALAGVDAVYQAAFHRAGVVRVFDLESMFECTELLTQHPQPVGPRVAIVTNAGGPGVMATDALLAERGQPATLSPATLETLDAFLPSSWSHGNPVDVLGDAGADRFVRAAEVVLQDPQVDTLIAILTPQAMTHPTETARRLAALPRPAEKTLLASWLGGEQMQEGKRLLREAGIPSFDTPEQAVRGVMHLRAYAEAHQIRCLAEETHREAAASSSSAPQPLIAAHAGDQPQMLSQFESKRILRDYGIPTTPIEVAETAERAVAVAAGFGYPVVLKIHSPEISHKTEVGGVALNLQDAGEVRAEFDAMIRRATDRRPDATVLGVTVEPMLSPVHGVELILGAKRDPVFGSVIMIGYGGIATELFQDRALELPPVSRASAERMLRSLRCWPLLSGFRGLPPANLERLLDVLVAFSRMVVQQPNLLEIDINPLMVAGETIIALDARVLLAPELVAPTEPYAHLAIVPR